MDEVENLKEGIVVEEEELIMKKEIKKRNNGEKNTKITPMKMK